MKRYIAIDGGTTNTRVSLVEEGMTVGTVKINVGARKSIGGNSELKNEVRGAISELLKEHNLAETDIVCAIASGMITSEYGLCKLDHLVAPVGIAELHNAMKRTALPEISDIPFVFIPGVKLRGGTLESSDMMRGEETELIGIGCEKGSVYVLPGSHSKLIRTDGEGRITDFVSMLSGELIAALVSSTILRDSVDLSVSEADTEYLLKGYSYCSENGVNASLFKVRVLKNMLLATPEQAYGFFLGVALHDEIEQIAMCEEKRVVIGGRRQLRESMALILKSISDKETVCLTDGEVDSSTVNGMIRIYEYGEI